MQGWAVCVVYCLDCQFVAEVPKFVAGCMQALSAMVLLELPHINVLTKVDLLGEENKVRSTSFAILGPGHTVSIRPHGSRILQSPLRGECALKRSCMSSSSCHCIP